MADILEKIIILSEGTLKKIVQVENKFHLTGEITEIIIRKMADLLLGITTEKREDLLRETARIIIEQVEQYWKIDFKPPPILQIKCYIENQYPHSVFLFDEAISFLINQGLIELDIRDRGVERIARPLK